VKPRLPMIMETVGTTSKCFSRESRVRGGV